MHHKDGNVLSLAAGVVALALIKNFTDRQAALLGLTPAVVALAVAGAAYVLRPA